MHGQAHDYFEYAGFWRRLLAFVIDGLILTLISSIILAGLLSADELARMEQITRLNQINWSLVAIEQTIPALWTIAFWSLLMATPGKLLLDCRIVDADTLQKARPAQLALRYLCYLVSFLPLGLGFIWIAFTRRKQGWHDKLANTVVILEDESLVPLESYL